MVATAGSFLHTLSRVLGSGRLVAIRGQQLRAEADVAVESRTHRRVQMSRTRGAVAAGVLLTLAMPLAACQDRRSARRIDTDAAYRRSARSHEGTEHRVRRASTRPRWSCIRRYARRPTTGGRCSGRKCPTGAASTRGRRMPASPSIPISRQADGPTAKLTPEYQAKLTKRIEDVKKGIEWDPISTCAPPGSSAMADRAVPARVHRHAESDVVDQRDGQRHPPHLHRRA